MPSETLIVDQSLNEKSKQIVSGKQISREIPNLRYIHSSERGLTVSRNLALEQIAQSTEIIHFIDDDVELHPDYIVFMNEAFLKDSALVGAGGKVLSPMNSEPTTDKRDKHKGLKFLSATKSQLGLVLRNGVNIETGDSNEPIDVDWISGCSMSYARRHIRGLRFDERRKDYSLGEDVDFGLRARAIGKLRYIPDAQLIHYLSPMNREKEMDLLSQQVVHRWTLAEDRLGNVSRFSVFFLTLGMALKRVFLFLATGNLKRFRESRLLFRTLWRVSTRGGLRPDE
jgi:GT2 family glycosyltransferase